MRDGGWGMRETAEDACHPEPAGLLSSRAVKRGIAVVLIEGPLYRGDRDPSLRSG